MITTAQVEMCLNFYETLEFRVEEDYGCYVLYAGDFKINVHVKDKEREPHATHIQSGSGDFCFEIGSNLVEFYDELKDKGIHVETTIVPRHGVKGSMQSFYVRDPDGTLIEFCSYSTTR